MSSEHEYLPCRTTDLLYRYTKYDVFKGVEHDERVRQPGESI